MILVPLAALGFPSLPVAPPGQQTEIVAFTPDAVSCAGQEVAVQGLVRPSIVVSTRYGPSEGRGPLPTYRFTFAIDEQGRARTIRRDPDASSGFYVDSSDLAPALAASRFPAGAPLAGCSVRYSASVTPIEAVGTRTLMELASRPDAANNAPVVWDRIRPAGSTCPGQPGQYRRLNMPAFETLPTPPGASAWVFISFDVDAAGRPTNVSILGSSGDAALDRAGTRALLDNRYAPGPGYRGCTYHFFHNGRSDRPSPPMPADAPADTGNESGCMVDPKSIAGLLNGSAYPRPFWRRAIEGVAVVSYDTAPWGAIGEVKVLTSEPDEAFGVAARNAFASARVAASETGRRGCVQHVRFRLPPQ